jgi:DNA-binding winged helix-turn-helix (wHTH) protein
MPVGENQTIRFGPFQLDTQCGQLRKDGVGLKLQGQPIQVLEILLEKPGQLVTREEIRQRLWTSDTFVDFDHSLNTAVKKLRQTLGDEADTPRYIETLPKRGYRFIGEVAREEPSEETLALFATAVPVGTVANPSQKRSRLLHWKWVLAGCAVTLLAVVSIEAYRSLKPDPLARITNSHLLVQNTFPVRALLTDGTSIYFQERRPSGLITSQVPANAIEIMSLELFITASRSCAP